MSRFYENRRSLALWSAGGVMAVMFVSSALAASVTPFLVRSDLFGIRIVEGSFQAGKLKEYVAEASDRIDPKWQTIRRQGREYGTLIPRQNSQDLVTTFDVFEVDPARPFLLDGGSDDIASYQITINGKQVTVGSVWRKSKIVDTALSGRFSREFVLQHDLVLSLARPVSRGDQISLTIADPNLPNIDLEFDDRSMISEAVHVSQLGFEPDDPSKVAYLSYWLGDRGRSPGSDGAVTYQVGQSFKLFDTDRGNIVYQGQIALDKSRNEPSNDRLNFNATDVYKMDFSAFTEPGRYFVQVDGIGRSAEFEIADDVWVRAFQVAMSGLYHQRSGLALVEPSTNWLRPRDFHPDDGVIIRQSTARLMDTSMGLNLAGIDSFQALVAGATDEVVSDAWGGWHDAGDWDRRTQHLRVSRDLLELALYRPKFAQETALSIPETGDAVPDLVDEALWNIDFFRRLQKSDGGVPGGVESSDHPRFGETSWLESQDVFVYAPDPWSSYEYAATAARAAHVLASIDPTRAATLRQSAISAMRWAEANASQPVLANAFVNNARNLAAIELYRLTKTKRWHQLFLTTTSYDGGPIAWNERQFEAVLVYQSAADLSLSVDAEVLRLGTEGLMGHARFLLSTGKRGAFGQIINPHTPYGFGYTSTVPADAAVVLVKAHLLRSDPAIFAAIVGETQFGLGANPDNLMFTSGMTGRSVVRPLLVDGLVLGRMPPGITIFGLWNVDDRGKHGVFAEIDEVVFPSMTKAAPVHETYHADVRAVPLSEFAIHSTIGPTAYVWGYLAATDP